MKRAAAALALFSLLALVTIPAEPRLRLCGFYWLTGRPCPLCGLTRALFALAKGRWVEAIHFHALSPLAFAMTFALFWEFRGRSRLLAAGLGAIGVYGVARAAGFLPA
jgi:hypothetical protein